MSKEISILYPLTFSDQFEPWPCEIVNLQLLSRKEHLWKNLIVFSELSLLVIFIFLNLAKKTSSRDSTRMLLHKNWKKNTKLFLIILAILSQVLYTKVFFCSIEIQKRAYSLTKNYFALWMFESMWSHGLIGFQYKINLSAPSSTPFTSLRI